MKINLFYLSPNTIGGWVTFTAHLMAGLRLAGADPSLYKIGSRTRERPRDFGYGETYQLMERFDAMVKVADDEIPSLIVAVAKKFKDIGDDLYHTGAKIVVHDPTEYKNLPEFISAEKCVLVRPSGQLYEEGARVILHPYNRIGSVERQKKQGRTTLCISTSRIDFDKNTSILLDANRILPIGKEIEIRGFENRIYSNFNLKPNYPEWYQSIWDYPRTREAAFELLEKSKWMADMSIIKGDGGGTQYTILEAWDAGTAVIIHKDWLRAGGEMQDGVNCHAVQDAEDLAEFLDVDTIERQIKYREKLVEQGNIFLEKHDAKIIAEQYLEFLHESHHSA